MIIAIASQKGGTGKTTTSIALAAGLARLHNKRVLLIDMDSQANSSKVLLPNYRAISKDDTVYASILERQPLPIHETTIPNLDIVPSHILLSETDVRLSSEIYGRESRLKKPLDKIKGNYDYVFIDCPPALSWLTINAFTAASQVLVVLSPGYFELDSIVQINRSIGETREYFNPSLDLLGYLFTMSDPTRNSAVSLELLRQTYPHDVLKTIIPRNTDIRDAHFHHTDIFDYNPSAKSAQAYKKLIQEVFING